MWIIWDAKKFITKTANTVKNVVNNPAVITDAIGTLNEQINNWTIQPIQPIQQPSTITGTFFDSEEPADEQKPIDIYNPFAPENQNKTNTDIFAGGDTADDLNFSYGGLSPTIAKSWIFPKPDPNAKDNRTAKQKWQEDWVDPFYKGTVIWKFETDLAEVINEADYNKEINKIVNEQYDKWRQWVAVWYDKGNDQVLRLEIWKLQQEKFEELFWAAEMKMSTAKTPEEEWQIWEEYKERMKDLFYLVPDKSLTSHFSEEDLEELSNNVIEYDKKDRFTMTSKYKPTDEQFYAYLDTLWHNSDLVDELSRNFYSNRLSNDEESAILGNMYDIAENGVMDKVKEKITSISWDEGYQAIQNFREFEWDQFTRILERCAPVFAYEKEALAKDPEKRNEWDWYVIESANLIRKALDKYSSNVNNWFGRIVDETVNSKWEITDALDVFADWKTLQEVLTNWLPEILGVETRLSNHVSPIDYFDFAAKDAEYRYRMANTNNMLKQGYYLWQHFLTPAWDWTNEVWQAIFTVPIRVGNLLALQFDWSPQSIAYIDMDASIGKLIETDDSYAGRTLKKFWFSTMEYAPEAIANIVPDLLVYRYFWAWAWAKTLINLWRVGRFTWNTRVLWIPLGKLSRWVKAQENINKLKERYTLVKKWLNAFEKMWELWKQWANIDSRRRRIWNIVDRTLTQFALWQIQNWKYWIFDYEPYSDESFYINTLWSVLFDILPEAIDFAWMAKSRNRLKWWHWWFNNWVWDVIDFMESSPENKQIVANALHKAHPEFTEQDLRNYLSIFTEVTDAAELVYRNLTKEWKAAANAWTKELLYNYVKQAHWENSAIWAAIRHIVRNQNTTAADILKYLWRIPWDVKIWPYESIIKLKHWTLAWVQAKDGWWYDPALDVLDGGFNRRVTGWFTDKDIVDISKIKGYEDTLKNKNKWFNKVWDTYYLNDEWLDAFWLSSRSLTLESLWVTVEQAENTREILKERMKDLNNKKIDPDTIDALADSGWYDELVNKVKEILC